jgi:hypothetical protein
MLNETKHVNTRATKPEPLLRWINISLRTIHLLGVAGVGGAFLYQAPVEVWQPYLILLIVSGAAMLSLEIWSNPHCLFQLRGVATLVKIGMLAASSFVGMETHSLIAIIAISGIISHAPGRVRYYQILRVARHGRIP